MPTSRRPPDQPRARPAEPPADSATPNGEELLAVTGTRRCLFGENHQIKSICEIVRKVARSRGPVLIRGESGTGKDVLAAAIHRQSPRAAGPFLAVNAGAIPAELFESELFGAMKGAFTGADRDRRGRFDEADGGTLFLDEIGEMPLLQQAKLLRVLQSGEIHPVGASRPHRVDTRVVAATNRNLEAMVRDGRFRDDLYFRLNLFVITIPPLRERREDILPLARIMAARFAAEQGLSEPVFAPEIDRFLIAYAWPGNIRELENAIHYAVTMAENDPLGPRHLPDAVRLNRSPFLPERETGAVSPSAALQAGSAGVSLAGPPKALAGVSPTEPTNAPPGVSPVEAPATPAGVPPTTLPAASPAVLTSSLAGVSPVVSPTVPPTLPSAPPSPALPNPPGLASGLPSGDLSSTLAEVERRHILAVYQAHGRNKTHTARALDISVRSLQMKLAAWEKER